MHSPDQSNYKGSPTSEPSRPNPSVVAPQTRRLRGLAVHAILQSLYGKWFSDSGGSRFITFLSLRTRKDRLLLEYFEQCGVDKIIRQIPIDIREFVNQFDDFEEIGIQHGTDPKFIGELEAHLQKAEYWRDHDEVALIVANFDLLRQSTDQILATPFMKHGPSKDLYFGFAYGGVRYFNVATLLAQWHAGKLMRKCPVCEQDAFCLRGGCGLSGGSLTAYCPACASTVRIDGTCIDCFTSVGNDKGAGPPHGYRLDEIVEILGGILPGNSGTVGVSVALRTPKCSMMIDGEAVASDGGLPFL